MFVANCESVKTDRHYQKNKKTTQIWKYSRAANYVSFLTVILLLSILLQQARS